MTASFTVFSDRRVKFDVSTRERERARAQTAHAYIVLHKTARTKTIDTNPGILGEATLKIHLAILAAYTIEYNLGSTSLQIMTCVRGAYANEAPHAGS
jgi:hypothetical protein